MFRACEYVFSADLVAQAAESKHAIDVACDTLLAAVNARRAELKRHVDKQLVVSQNHCTQLLANAMIPVREDHMLTASSSFFVRYARLPPTQTRSCLTGSSPLNKTLASTHGACRN